MKKPAAERVPLSTRIPAPQLTQLEHLVAVHRSLRDPAVQRGRVTRGDVVAAALAMFANVDVASQEKALARVRGE